MLRVSFKNVCARIWVLSLQSCINRVGHRGCKQVDDELTAGFGDQGSG